VIRVGYLGREGGPAVFLQPVTGLGRWLTFEPRRAVAARNLSASGCRRTDVCSGNATRSLGVRSLQPMGYGSRVGGRGHRCGRIPGGACPVRLDGRIIESRLVVQPCMSRRRRELAADVARLAFGNSGGRFRPLRIRQRR
jgi:hypothetical protein